MKKKNRKYMPKLFEEKPTKGEKIREFIYNLMSTPQALDEVTSPDAVAISRIPLYLHLLKVEEWE